MFRCFMSSFLAVLALGLHTPFSFSLAFQRVFVNGHIGECVWQIWVGEWEVIAKG